MMRGGQPARFDAAERLRPEMFTGKRQAIAKEALARIEAGDRPDLPTLTGRLEEELAEECETCREIKCTPSNCNTYYDSVRAAHLRRKMMHLGERFVGEALDMESGSLEAAEVAQEEFERGVLKLSGEALAGDGPRHASELTDKAMEMLWIADQEILTGVTTGFRETDKITRGWQPGFFNVVAARTSMGKSAFMGQCATASAMGEAGVRFDGSYEVDPVPTAIFSLEMPGWELMQRMVCERAKVNGKKRNKTDEEWRRIQRARAELDDAPIFIDDQPGMTTREIGARLRRLVREENVGSAWVDYLQIVGKPRGVEFGSKNDRIGAITRELRDLAKDLGIPITALAQINRGVEKGPGDSRPVISDLRASGEIEEAANFIAMLYRDMYYGITVDADGNPTQVGIDGLQADITEFIVGKHRGGPVGTRKLAFVDEQAAFRDLEEHHLEAPGPAYEQDDYQIPEGYGGDGSSRPSAPIPDDDTPF